MKNIHYSLDDEENYTIEQIKQILVEFSDVKGLSEVLNETKNLFDNESFIKIFKEAQSTAEKDYNRLNFSDGEQISNDSLLGKYPQLKYASIFKKPVIYMPSLHGDLIMYTTFISTFTLLSTICNVKFGHLISIERLFSLLDRVMVLLDNFNQDLNFTSPDQEFYEKIKNIKWDKKAKKLNKKIQNIRNNITNVNSGNMDMYNTRFNLTESYLIIFLAASSAVNCNRDKISVDDLINSLKTYYKLVEIDNLNI